jgi:hypothetical protein
MLVPDIVPIAFAEEPQPGWAVQVAFLLRAIELLSAAVAIITLVLTAVVWARRRLCSHFTRAPGVSSPPTAPAD